MSNVRDFGARGDGKNDDSQAITHALAKGDGRLYFPRGEYRITRPIQVPLQMHGRLTIDGDGGLAKVVMTAAGPALHLVGTHQRTAEPSHFVEGGGRGEGGEPRRRAGAASGRHTPAYRRAQPLRRRGLAA